LWPVAVTSALVAISPLWAIESGWWWVRADVWITTIALAGATFAIGMALRGRRLPRVLVWFGLISYSLYLVHHPVLKYFVEISGDLRRADLPVQLGMSVLAVAVIVGASALTYRYVERPMQELGRRVSRRRRHGLQGGGDQRNARCLTACATTLARWTRSGDGVAGASPRAISSTGTSTAASQGSGSGQIAYVSTILPPGSCRQLVECTTTPGSPAVTPASLRAAPSGLSPCSGWVMACR
jgi:hypothetical protein